MSRDDLEGSSAESPALEPPKLAVIHVNGVRQAFWYRNGEEVFMPPLGLESEDDEADPH